MQNDNFSSTATRSSSKAAVWKPDSACHVVGSAGSAARTDESRSASERSAAATAVVDALGLMTGVARTREAKRPAETNNMRRSADRLPASCGGDGGMP